MLKNARIRTKLLLLLLLPIAGLVVFSLRDMYQKYQTLQQAEQTKKLVAVSVRTTSLVHELQKERGLSSGFLNSKGARFRDELGRQRAVTDRSFQELAAALSADPAAAAVVASSLRAAETRKGTLPEMRSRIDGQAVEGKDAFAFYTGMNYSYLDVTAAVARNSSQTEIMRAATAYFFFTKLKEEMGKERATLNAVIANKAFNDETLRRTISILASQGVFAEGFGKFASPEALAGYLEHTRSAEFKRAEELREGVLAKAATGGFDVAPETWFEAITAKIDVMKQVEESLSRDILQQASRLADGARTGLVISVGCTALLGVLTLLLTAVLVRSITSPLNKLVELLKDVAQGEGDLTKRLKTTQGMDEIGELSRWFNRFVDNIHGIVSQVSSTTTRVATAATQLHSTAEQIATAAEEVACQSATVATASEEMSATSTDIAHNCTLASDVANRASQLAKDSASVVQETLHGMEQIAARVQETASTISSLGGRSDEIGAIVSTIEEIADQTNLLALNAAIEAARAGDMGRGFAVVADEVRALAERTASATQEIGKMIKMIQQDTAGAVNSMNSGVKVVELGMESSHRSSLALEQVLQAIDEVNAQVAQIATAAEEQTATTGEITSNIQQITEVVQFSADGAHETAGAASSLSNSAHDLKNLVGRFKL